MAKCLQSHRCPEKASTISVGELEEKTADFIMQSGRVLSISGTVNVDAPGTKTDASLFFLVPRDPEPLQESPTLAVNDLASMDRLDIEIGRGNGSTPGQVVISRNGRFQLSGVSPGSYDLFTEELDIAYGNAKSTFERINSVPAFYGWRDELEHIGTFGAANGGELGVITVKWLDWQTRGNSEAAKMFKCDHPGRSLQG